MWPWGTPIQSVESTKKEGGGEAESETTNTDESQSIVVASAVNANSDIVELRGVTSVTYAKL